MKEFFNRSKISYENQSLLRTNNCLAPLIPDHPLTWNGIPLFHVGAFPDDYSGKLFFVMGQGLGDHVNGFRVLHEVKKRFPNARCILYADRRWEELVARISDIDVRWYPKAIDPRSKSGTNDPYKIVRREIFSEINFAKGNAFLAYDHFPMPDRHARGETTLEAIARTIGLSLGDKARPVLPLLDSDLTWTDHFIKNEGLQEGHYVVISPYSWPNKMWSKDKFSKLIDILQEKHGLRSVIVSYPEIGSFTNPGVVMATDLSLGQIGGLLFRSGMYVGLDSGPSHMAAAFDIPMVVIFKEKKTIPFEVRTLSPWSLHIVEGFESSDQEPTFETVAATFSFLWHCRNTQEGPFPQCPACHRMTRYVVGSGSGLLLLMCVCGLKMMSQGTRTLHQGKDLSNSNLFVSETPAIKGDHLSIICEDHLANSIDIQAVENVVRSNRELRINIVSYWKKNLNTRPLTYIDPRSVPTIYWTFDALIFWMSRLGYTLDYLNRSEKDEMDEWNFTFYSIEQQHDTKKLFRIPWSNGTLTATSSEYLTYYSFGKWGRFDDLVGIVKSLTSLGYHKEAVKAAWKSFRENQSLRSFRWVLKTVLFWLGNRTGLISL